MVRGGSAAVIFSRRGGGFTRGRRPRFSQWGQMVEQHSSRLGIIRLPFGRRRRANVFVDRRPVQTAYFRPDVYAGRGGYVMRASRGRGRFRGNFRRGRGGDPGFRTFQGGRGRGGGFRGGRRGRRGGSRGGAVTEASLNSELDTYMGLDATKSRLDNQLDAFFGRATTSSTATPSNEGAKQDPIGDPSDVTMA